MTVFLKFKPDWASCTFLCYMCQEVGVGGVERSQPRSLPAAPQNRFPRGPKPRQQTKPRPAQRASVSSLIWGPENLASSDWGRKPTANTQSTVARPCWDSPDGTRVLYPKSPTGADPDLPWTPSGDYYTPGSPGNTGGTPDHAWQPTYNTDLCLLLSHAYLLDTQAQGPATYPSWDLRPGHQLCPGGAATGHRMTTGMDPQPYRGETGQSEPV